MVCRITREDLVYAHKEICQVPHRFLTFTGGLFYCYSWRYFPAGLFRASCILHGLYCALLRIVCEWMFV